MLLELNKSWDACGVLATAVVVTEGCARMQPASSRRPLRSSATMEESSWSIILSCSMSSSLVGTSLNLTVFIINGQHAIPKVAVCAASISAGESPRTTRFIPGTSPLPLGPLQLLLAMRLPNTSLKVSRFQANTSPGQVRSHFRRAERMGRCDKSGITRGAYLRVLSMTHWSSALVTMHVSPRRMACNNTFSIRGSSCWAWCCLSWLALIAELHMRVSSQSKMSMVSCQAVAFGDEGGRESRDCGLPMPPMSADGRRTYPASRCVSCRGCAGV
mmetsp:Transcript_53620/g.149180  ORF Transcript_53620/g.149180 Transcript_53620/m.149180 type:complete len:273 (+) Transcript_53620:296-1114(+)